MAHLLIIELPGGNDTDVIDAALRMGHSFVFLTQDLQTYKNQPQVDACVRQAAEIIESRSFDLTEVSHLVQRSHARKKIDALLCLLDIRLIEASLLAEQLALKFLNAKSAVLLRDKYSVRQRLKHAGIAQPEFTLATNNEDIAAAIQTIGLPILMKPSDGYGSQNILTMETELDLELAADALSQVLPLKTNYGLGVTSNDRLLVERYMKGVLIGCDTFTSDRGRHQLLGINEKLMFEPPSFAIRGGCFTPNQGQWGELEAYLFAILDAVDFNCGAAHIEIMLTEQGPRLVEINARLVGAKIARLMGYALQQSVHEQLIHLHLGQPSFADLQPAAFQPAVTRWLVAPSNGQLERIELPSWTDEGIQCVELFASSGDEVSYPFENAQRLGYVMTSAQTREHAEQLAEKFWADTTLTLKNVKAL